jgi:hypothetical protein
MADKAGVNQIFPVDGDREHGHKIYFFEYSDLWECFIEKDLISRGINSRLVHCEDVANALCYYCEPPFY